MLSKQLQLTNEQTSPLFRIMWVHNIDEPYRRHFDNNICAFHIGNGLILSVAHNLKTESQIFKSIDETIYLANILPYLNTEEVQLFEECCCLDSTTQKRYVNFNEPDKIDTVINILKRINFDTRWVSLAQQKICKPYLIIQFRNNQFYNDDSLTNCFDKNTNFYEPDINRHTFLIEVALVEAFYSEDIALYRIVHTPQAVIDSIPSIEIDFSVLADNQTNYYCLQSSPNSEVGKLLNKAQIEGYLDHFGVFSERFGGNYLFEGLRYLIKGYFRFGSSGAPYVFFDSTNNKFKANAIQSEACPIQLSIDGNRIGNFQYINAIASPLNIIEHKLLPYLNNLRALSLK